MSIKRVSTYLHNINFDPNADIPIEYLPEICINFNQTTIIVGTFAMMFRFRNILSEVKHIFVEESSIAAHSDTHLLYCQTKAETLVSIGDPLQLHPYRSRDLRQFPRHNVIPLADHLEYHAPFAVVQLTTVNRSHPEIVKAVSFAAYEIFGDVLDTSITAEERANITGSLVPLAHKDYPILLIQCTGESVVQATYSR